MVNAIRPGALVLGIVCSGLGMYGAYEFAFRLEGNSVTYLVLAAPVIAGAAAIMPVFAEATWRQGQPLKSLLWWLALVPAGAVVFVSAAERVHTAKAGAEAERSAHRSAAERARGTLAKTEANVAKARADANKARGQKQCGPDCRTKLGPGSASIYGLHENRVEMTAEEWRQCVHPDDTARLVAESRRALANRQRELVCVFRILRNGEVRWIETRNRYSYDKTGRATQAIGASIDVTERRRAEDHKSILVAELDHRVKNALACVAAIAQHAHEGSKTMDEFLGGFNGRIQCLANTHVLLSRTRWQGVSLATLVHGELAYCMKDDNTHIQGPDIDLVAEATEPIATVLHELATNAGKYGALSNSHGRVSVCWEWQLSGGSSSGLTFEWRETGGPRVVAPRTFGYGSTVIRDLIPYELGGTVDYVLAPDGVSCKLEIPAKWLSNPCSTLN